MHVFQVTRALLASCILGAAGLSASSLAATTAVPIDGTIVLKPIAIKSCKSASGKLAGKQVTQVACTSTGTLTGKPRLGGVGSGWLWTRHASGRTDEAANVAVNFGNGVVTFALTGSMKVIGKATKKSGHGVTTGTWSFKSGTGAYKGLHGRGTYSLDFKRNATRYTSFKMALRGRLS